MRLIQKRCLKNVWDLEGEMTLLLEIKRHDLVRILQESTELTSEAKDVVVSYIGKTKPTQVCVPQSLMDGDPSASGEFWFDYPVEQCKVDRDIAKAEQMKKDKAETEVT